MIIMTSTYCNVRFGVPQASAIIGDAVRCGVTRTVISCVPARLRSGGGHKPVNSKMCGFSGFEFAVDRRESTPRRLNLKFMASPLSSLRWCTCASIQKYSHGPVSGREKNQKLPATRVPRNHFAPWSAAQAQVPRVTATDYCNITIYPLMASVREKVNCPCNDRNTLLLHTEIGNRVKKPRNKRGSQ